MDFMSVSATDRPITVSFPFGKASSWWREYVSGSYILFYILRNRGRNYRGRERVLSVTHG